MGLVEKGGFESGIEGGGVVPAVGVAGFGLFGQLGLLELSIGQVLVIVSLLN